ncbi:MAG TPA: integrin alpha [Candidatus Polarisedimenticolia bacterium]|jgi:hypothetical protein|nr:integrin alpha [Candidatus Polarisedimenticolia bacterium]
MFQTSIRLKRSSLVVAVAVFLGARSSALADLRPGDWLTRAQEEIRRSEYGFSPLGDGAWAAPNRAQNLRSRLGADGLEVAVRMPAGGGDGWAFRLRLSRFGRAGALETVENAPPILASDRIELHREALALVEWYLNDARGIEQGFTVGKAPEGGTGPIVLEMAFPGEATTRMEDGGGTVAFTPAPGGPVLRYGGLAAWDAAGRALASGMDLRPGRLRLHVDDSGAIYPITIDPLLTNPAWTTEGNQGGAQLGLSVASAGDVNGDGFDDVIVGAYMYDGGELNEGKVFVYHGSVLGLSASADWTAEGNQANAQLGRAVASAGNVNGDCCDDIIVGVPFYDIGPVAGNDRGLALVWHGSLAGLGDPGTPTNADWGAESGQNSSQFGWSVASAGDVDGDGFDEVLVGAPLYETPAAGTDDEGRAFLYRGLAGGLSPGPVWIAESNQLGAQFGYSVASAGHVDFGPFADIVIGAPLFDAVAGDNKGAAFVWEGSPGGPAIPGIPGTASWSALGEDGDRYGWSVASAGDVNGDGFGDLIVGAPQADVPDADTNEGRAFVYLGAPGGLVPAAPAAWTVQSNQLNAQLGYSVASAGDVDDDGYDDVILGAPFYDDTLGANSGQAFLWHGSAADLGVDGTPTNAHWFATVQAGAQFGISVASAGDVNGDDNADVLVGASFYRAPELSEGGAFVYLGFDPPVYLEFGPKGDPRRVEAVVTGYSSVGYLPASQYLVSGSATVKMGNCAVPAACTRSFSFAALTVTRDAADTALNGKPAFRVVAGSATVSAPLDPIIFPAADDLDIRLHSFTLGPSGAASLPGVVGPPRLGMWLKLPDSLTSAGGEDLPFPPVLLEQDLDFAISIALDPALFYIAPKDYPFQIRPQAGTSVVLTRSRAELGLSDLVFPEKERGEEIAPGQTRCDVSGACGSADDANDGIFGLGWSVNSPATPYFVRSGLRATLSSAPAGATYALLFPAGASIGLSAGSSIEFTDTEPGGGSLSGTLTLTLHTGDVIAEAALDGYLIHDDCTGQRSISLAFIGGTLLPGGELRIPPPGLSGLSELFWGDTGNWDDPDLRDPRGFFAGGLGPDSLSFFAPGTVARIGVTEPTVQDHLLARQGGGPTDEPGIYAGLNIDLTAAAGTVGIDTTCPPPDPPASPHSFTASSDRTQLYVRRSGVSGIADAGTLALPGVDFPYMGYRMTLGRFGASILDNIPLAAGSGLVVNSIVIPSPSDVRFTFSSPTSVDGCANLGENGLGQMADAGDPKVLACWQADIVPRAARLDVADCAGGPCSPVIPANCPDLLCEQLRYLRVSAEAPLDLQSQILGVPDPPPPASDRFEDMVPMDFTPEPEGPLACSDIILTGSHGSIRNKLEKDHGFDIDLMHASLEPRNPSCGGAGAGRGPGASPSVIDADTPRYDVTGEILVPFYDAPDSCIRVTQGGGVDTFGDCGAFDSVANKVHVSRRILAGLVNLDFDLKYMPPIRDVGSVRDTAARFVSESGVLDFKFFKLPALVKLFGDNASLGDFSPDEFLPRLRPELYLGFLSDLALYTEATENPSVCDSDCTGFLNGMMKFENLDLPGEIPSDAGELVPALKAGAARLGLPASFNLRSYAAGAMRDAVSDLLPADVVRAAGRVKGVINGIRDVASVAQQPFKVLNLSGPGAFRLGQGASVARDFAIDTLNIDADVDILGFLNFKGFVNFNSHTANTEDEFGAEDTADVTVGAHNVDLGWAIDGVRAKTVQATFRFDPPTFAEPDRFRVWGFDGEIDLSGVKFGEVEFDELGFCLGMGDPDKDVSGDDYYYLAGMGRGKYKAVTASGGFFLGKSVDIAPIQRIDPEVGEVLEGLDTLTGIYARAEASFPVMGGPECVPYRLNAGGGAAFWLFEEGPTFGAKIRAYATGSLVCAVTARADLTLLGGLTDDVWHLGGYGFLAGGVGWCEPNDWDTRRDVLNDDWCLSCVMDGEFSTDSQSGTIDGDLNGPDCSGP